ncbi:hypothetical protein YC2023_099530 [Brassica napus]
MYTAQGHCICMWKEHERSPGRERHVSIAHFALYSVYANGLVCCIACYKYGNLIPEKYTKKWADHSVFAEIIRICGRVVKAFRGFPRDPNSNPHHNRFP